MTIIMALMMFIMTIWTTKWTGKGVQPLQVNTDVNVLSNSSPNLKPFFQDLARTHTKKENPQNPVPLQVNI